MNSNLSLIIIVFSLIINITYATSESSFLDINDEITPQKINVIGSEHPDTATVKLDITGGNGISRRDVDAVLVVDTSNSMFGSHMAAAKGASKKFVSGMDDSRDRIGFVSFNSTIGPNMPPVNNFSLVNDTINATIIDKNDGRGITCLGLGLNKAIDMLSSGDRDSVKTIILLSDGNNKTCKGDNPCADALRARDLGIIIFAVGINDSENGTKNLKCMAETTGGSYYAADNDVLEKIFEDLSINIPNIIAKDVRLRYVVPDQAEVTNVRPSEPLGRSNGSTTISWNLGTISINETKTISFKVGSEVAKTLYLTPDNQSKIEYTGSDGREYEDNISMGSVDVIKPTPIDPIDIPIDNAIKPVHHQYAPAKNLQFYALGSNITRKSINTKMKITKIVASGSSGPHITLRLSAPPVEEIKTGVVIAVDSSGSLGMGGRAEYGENVRQSIPKILEKIEANLSSSNVSILSWDDDIDFVYPPVNNNDISSSKMMPISSVRNEVEQLGMFGSDPNWIDTVIGYIIDLIQSGGINIVYDNASTKDDYYICLETESTNLSVGLDAAREILNNTKKNNLDGTRKLILFITARSEFEPCDESMIIKAKNEHCDIHTIGIGVINDSMLYHELNKIAGDKNVMSQENPLGRNASKYHYSPGSSNFNRAAASTAVDDALKQFFKENISNNILVVDTLYPYLRIDNQSIVAKINGQILDNKSANRIVHINSDDTTTLQVDIDGKVALKPSDYIEISFDTYLDLSLPVDVTILRRSKSYHLGVSTPNSSVSYDWLGNGIRYSIPLPESSLVLETL
ncbi:MAG: VWA domain-containing protein [Methanotrichaceae archaeon]|nr:VWA domain-containing protein [Methanotrichaceae archaeon]